MRNRRPAVQYPSPKEVAQFITEYLESTFDALVELRQILSNQLNDQLPQLGYQVNRASLAGIRTKIQETLRQHDHSIDGIGIATVEGFLKDSQYWLEWWRFDRNDELEFVAHTLNPSNDVFYDYASQTWFTNAVESPGPSLTGPYVDAGGTGEYTVTLCIPVRVGDTVAGVFGSDIDTSHFEAIVPSYRASDVSMVLVNSDRRVIASNVAAHLPGEVSDDFENAMHVDIPVKGIEPDNHWRLWFW